MNYSDIKIGEVYSFERIVKMEDILDFAKISGDFNKIHVDKEYGEKSIFKNNIAHGMLVSSLFSALVGMYCPGENSLYLSQSMDFKNPVFPGNKIVVKGTVLSKNDSIKIITMKTEALCNGKIVVTGEAKIKLLN